VQVLPGSTRTAQEAAQAVGCTVGQIVKSLIFQGAQSGRPYLLLVSGANRVRTELLVAHLGEELHKPDAEYVRQVSGFAIGGVPPIGHPTPLPTLIDAELFQYERVYAAGGTPSTLFSLTPKELLALTGGRVLPLH
jgi:prolyl-tRNA editing enzyme YbaK/EbsC (Cys-tRNA(Pro) deacylase)